MATSRRRTAKKDVGQNLGELESRVKKVERRPRASIGSFSITSDLIAPGSITIDKLDPALLALLQDIADNAGSAGDSSEYIVSGGEDGDGLVTGVVDSVISQFDFSTTSASGKNSIYWQDTAPTGGEYVEGDIWYDTSLSPVDNLPQYTPHQYKDGAWVAAEFGDGAFRFIDAAKISTGILDAGVAIRVGTYPLTNALVGKSRVEIAATFPTREAASGEDPATIPTFSGIRVLTKTEVGQTETGGFYPSLLINADSGNFRVGSATRYLSYTASTDKVILSGTILTGADENGNATSESLLIGTDVSTPLGETDGKDGIRLGPYNYWYRPNSVTGSTSLIFKVGSSGNEGLTVTKGGAVNFEGTANPTGGVIKGKLSIRAVAGAVDRIEIGQNVLSNRDGFRIDNNNHWTVSNTGGSTAFSVGSSTKQLTYDTVSGLLKLTGGDITLTGGGTFKTADANTRVEMTSDGIFGYKAGTANPIFYIRASDGTASFEGETNPTSGTVKGKLTIQGTTYAFGKDVMSTRDGLYLNANNHWVLSQTGGSSTFRVGGSSKYLEYNSASETFTINADTISLGGVSIQSSLNGKADNSGSTILSLLNTGMGTGVVLTSDGKIYSAGKTSYNSSTAGWYLGRDITVVGGVSALRYTFGIGNATNYLRWDGDSVNVRGSIEATSGEIGGWDIDSTTIYSQSSSAGLPYVRLTSGTDPKIEFGDEDSITTFKQNSINMKTSWSPSANSGPFQVRQSVSGTATTTDLALYSIVNTTTRIGGIRLIDTVNAPNYPTLTGASSAFSMQVDGNVTINGNLTVTGTGGGSSGGYRNATDGTTTNKITYGGSPPGTGTGRSAGDIHIEF